MDNTAEKDRINELIDVSLGITGLCRAPAPPTGALCLYGFAAFAPYSFTVNPLCALDKKLFSSLTSRARRSVDPVFLQHCVDRCMMLKEPVQLLKGKGTNGEYLWRMCSDLQMFMQIHSRGQLSEISGTRSLPTPAKVHCLTVWHVVGHALACGACRSDFSLQCIRSTRVKFEPFPVLPSADVIAAQRKKQSRSATLKVGVSPKVRVTLPVLRGSSNIKGFMFDPEVKIQAVIASEGVSDVKNKFQKCVKESVALGDMLDCCTSESTGPVVAAKAVPGGSIVVDSRKRMDVAAMLANREIYKACGPYYRYLCFDCSPMGTGSWEVLNTIEVVINRAAVRGKTFNELDGRDICRRKLPPVTLAQGSADASNRCFGVLHQNWLEYGPTEQNLRAAVDDVYECFTDMGTEQAVNDFWDIIDIFVKDIERVSPLPTDCQPPEPNNRFLFRNSMGVVGPLHAIDWLIRTALSKLEFFDDLIKHCKLILQFFSARRHRTFLKGLARTKDIGEDELEDIDKSLATSCARFANWRWRSMQKCSKDMKKLQPTLDAIITEPDDIKSWPMKITSEVVTALTYAVTSPEIWRMLLVVDFLIDPLKRLHGWFTGCACHDQSKRQYKGKVHCPFQGLRAKDAAKRVEKTISEYEDMRRNLGREEWLDCCDCEVISASEVYSILGFIIAMLNLKMLKWMRDLPYFIWEVMCMGVLCECDSVLFVVFACIVNLYIYI